MTAKMFYFHAMQKTTSVSSNSEDTPDEVFLLAE
jgi:hypothetical protein